MSESKPFPTEPEIFDELRKIIVEQLGVEEDEVKRESSIVDDLNADSLNLVELIMSVEERMAELLGIKFSVSDEEAEKLVTVQDIVNFIMALRDDPPKKS